MNSTPLESNLTTPKLEANIHLEIKFNICFWCEEQVLNLQWILSFGTKIYVFGVGAIKFMLVLLH